MSFLPDEVVSFNPSNADEVDSLLCKYGPEGAYEIAQVLIKAATEDVDTAVHETLTNQPMFRN